MSKIGLASYQRHVARWKETEQAPDLIAAIAAFREARGRSAEPGGKRRWMLCEGCDWEARLFLDGPDDYQCSKCGWFQSSEEGAAAELCLAATWHSRDAYKQMRLVALSCPRYEGRIPEEPMDFEE